MFLWLVKGYEVAGRILLVVTPMTVDGGVDEWGKVYALGVVKYSMNKSDAHTIYVHVAAPSRDEALCLAVLDLQKCIY